MGRSIVVNFDVLETIIVNTGLKNKKKVYLEIRHFAIKLQYYTPKTYMYYVFVNNIFQKQLTYLTLKYNSIDH